MAAFEVSRGERGAPAMESASYLDQRRLREECIIALKVYDSCRNQDCLTDTELGPARSAEAAAIGALNYKEGDVIVPPDNAAAVTIDRLRVKKIIVVEKVSNPFRRGYWDIGLKYVFEYRLCFREADGSVIGSVKANSIFNKQITLFGSVGEDLVLATDLIRTCNESTTIDSEPFIIAEAKAVALTGKLHYPRTCGCADDANSNACEVHVTIGLFTIIRLFRIVDLSVQSNGFCVPPESEECSPVCPCEFFERLDFPMDIFAPPQKPEFFAGIDGSIPFTERCGHDERRDCC